MGTILGVEILQRAQTDLKDPKEVRWKLADLLRYLNDGQREIAVLRPDSSVVSRSIQLSAATTRQLLPDDAHRLISITRNMGGDGNTPGLPITIVNLEDLDQNVPLWHSSATTSVIKHFVFDGRVPKAFYVYPRPLAGVWVEAHMQVAPREVTVQAVNNADASSPITIDDLYQTALFDYVMMRAYWKDTDAQDIAYGDRAYQRFLNRLGMKVQIDKAFDPNKNSPPAEPKRAQENGAPAF